MFVRKFGGSIGSAWRSRDWLSRTGGLSGPPVLNQFETGDLMSENTTPGSSQLRLLEPDSVSITEAEALTQELPWNEEDRRRIAAFFRLLDEWDREESKMRQVA